MRTRLIAAIVAIALFSAGNVLPGIAKTESGRPFEPLRGSAEVNSEPVVSPITGTAAISKNWLLDTDDEQIGNGRWRVTSRGTNTSGTKLYDCVARLRLDGPGRVFPESTQVLGDFANGQSFVVVWTVEGGPDLKGYVVLWCGWPERDPKKRSGECE